MTEPKTEWERGSWMQTYTGRAFYPMAALVEDIDPLDIAHALSMCNRYGGHTTVPYSVAEHCVLMSYVIAPEFALRALLHDATEAYIGDIVRPLKRHLPEYSAIEDRLMLVIGDRFGVEGPIMTPEVKDVDNRILLDERAALLGTPPEAWAVEGMEPLGITINAWPWYIAKVKYINRLNELLGV